MSGMIRLMAFTIVLVMIPGAAMACARTDAPPEIRLSLTETPAAFDLSRTADELNHAGGDLLGAYPSAYHARVGGLTQGRISLNHKVVFETRTMKDRSCAMIREIDVTLNISPTVYVAGEMQQSACWFKRIFAHEGSHVETDRTVMRTYAPRIRDGLRMIMAAPRDYTSGWVASAAIDGVKDAMEGDVRNALGALFSSMMEERGRLQAEIDSPGEYMSISAACQPSS